MAEVEIHTAHEAHADGFGQAVGIVVGIIGILLAVVTILSHREHTAAVVHQTQANDRWDYYQAKKIREHTSKVGADLLAALASDPAKVAAISGKFTQDSERYAKEAEPLLAEATERETQSKHAEERAIRFDLAEGFLELGLVMSSLYFLSRKRFFVALGSLAAAIGTVIGVIGLLA
jgi:hypothetical protein